MSKRAAHSFVRGRCLKTVLDDDPLKCREGHDRPKSEVLCCSMHKPGDLLYNKGFTKCRSLVGFPPGCGNKCEYTVSPGLRESRTQEGTHRFYRFRTPLRGRTHRFYWVAPFLLAPFLLGGTAFFKFLIKIKWFQSKSKADTS